MHTSPISKFINDHFRHFNAGVLRDAAQAYKRHIHDKGKVVLSISGAMSTAEIGLSLAQMIREDKIHAISCTGANLEEDIFNLVAHDYYVGRPNYRELSPQNELALFKRDLNRVTDVCIPDMVIWDRLEFAFKDQWRYAEEMEERFFPHEFVYKVLRNGGIEKYYQIDPNDSWVYAAMERNLPIFVPGWEDSALANMFAASCICGQVKNCNLVRSAIEYVIELVSWYSSACMQNPMGIFQIGGGIAGNFPINAVRILQEYLSRNNIRKWKYFCKIGDATSSYGSSSGTIPSKNISWGNLDATAQLFLIESDATIVAPLIFADVLDW